VPEVWGLFFRRLLREVMEALDGEECCGWIAKVLE
jgi:hypothetical protein